MQTFLPVADFEDERPAAGLPATGQAAGGDACRSCGRSSCPTTAGPTTRPSSCGAAAPPALVAYGLAMVRVWRERGFADTTETPDRRVRARGGGDAAGRAGRGRAAALVGRRRGAAPLAPVQPARQGPGLLPAALRRAVRARARRPALRLARSRTTSPPRRRPRACGVWVVRPRAHGELGACLAAGVVGLGTQSGIDVDATGLDAGRAAGAVQGAVGTAAGEGPAPAVGVPRRDARPATRSRCRSSTAPGCCSARSSGTTCSRAASCCRTAGRPAGTGSCRGRRPVPPATLQDPRALFSVVLDPARCSASSGARQRHVLQPDLARGRPACRRRRG